MRTTTATRTTRRTFFALLALGFALSLSGLAQASTVSGWWGGQWTCEIDGRPARMRWKPVDDTQTECDGDVCSQTSGATWAGEFSDNGSAWVRLTFENRGSRGGIFFRHADGNRWFLAQPQNGRSTGWTTWNGQRYRLACWR